MQVNIAFSLRFCCIKMSYVKGGLAGDCEELRKLDRIKAISWRIAKEGATFITKKWIANKLKRDESWVKRNWKKSFEEASANYVKKSDEEIFSQETKNIVLDSTCKRRRSCRQLAAKLKQLEVKLFIIQQFFAF